MGSAKIHGKRGNENERFIDGHSIKNEARVSSTNMRVRIMLKTLAVSFARRMGGRESNAAQGKRMMMLAHAKISKAERHPNLPVKRAASGAATRVPASDSADRDAECNVPVHLEPLAHGGSRRNVDASYGAPTHTP